MRRTAFLVLFLCLGLGLVMSGCEDGGGSSFVPVGATSGSGGTGSTSAGSTSGSASQGTLPAPRKNTARVVARYGEGFLEVDGGRKILHLKGTSYERGVQYGYLVADEIETLLNKMQAYVAKEGKTLGTYAQSLLTPTGALAFKPFWDQDALEEVRGIVDGMRAAKPSTFVGEEDLIFLNSIIDLGAIVDLDVFSCSGLAVWGPISEGGKLFQTRCVDLMVGSGIEDHCLIIMARPEGGVPYVNPAWAGFIGCPSGLNAHGVGISQVWAFSKDKGLGHPWPLTTRELMIQGTSVDDAVRLLRNDARTYGSNFVFADRGDTRGGVPKGLAIEVSQKDMAVFTDDDPKEDQAQYQGQSYAYRIPNAVFRGDCAMDPTLRSRQTASNGPTGDPRTSGAYKSRYEGQALAILDYVKKGQPIGADECIAITKKVAMRNDSLQCNVYANSDLEIWVANARVESDGTKHMAFNEPYHQYSLDYYTPTAELRPLSTSVAAGGTVRVQVPIDSLGRARALTLRGRLDVNGTTHQVPVQLKTEPIHLPERGSVTAEATIDLPTLPALKGSIKGRLVLDLLEYGTTDLVDIATAELTITP